MHTNNENLPPGDNASHEKYFVTLGELPAQTQFYLPATGWDYRVERQCPNAGVTEVTCLVDTVIHLPSADSSGDFKFLTPPGTVLGMPKHIEVPRDRIFFHLDPDFLRRLRLVLDGQKLSYDFDCDADEHTEKLLEQIVSLNEKMCANCSPSTKYPRSDEPPEDLGQMTVADAFNWWRSQPDPLANQALQQLTHYTTKNNIELSQLSFEKFLETLATHMRRTRDELLADYHQLVEVAQAVDGFQTVNMQATSGSAPDEIPF